MLYTPQAIRLPIVASTPGQNEPRNFTSMPAPQFNEEIKHLGFSYCCVILPHRGGASGKLSRLAARDFRGDSHLLEASSEAFVP